MECSCVLGLSTVCCGVVWHRRTNYILAADRRGSGVGDASRGACASKEPGMQLQRTQAVPGSAGEGACG